MKRFILALIIAFYITMNLQKQVSVLYARHLDGRETKFKNKRRKEYRHNFYGIFFLYQD